MEHCYCDDIPLDFYCKVDFCHHGLDDKLQVPRGPRNPGDLFTDALCICIMLSSSALFFFFCQDLAEWWWWLMTLAFPSSPHPTAEYAIINWKEIQESSKSKPLHKCRLCFSQTIQMLPENSQWRRFSIFSKQPVPSSMLLL